MNLMTRAVDKLRLPRSRSGLIAKNVIASFAIRGGSMIIALLTMPAYMKYFEDQQILGMWFTLLSVLSWILNFDLGLGNGLRNRLVGAIAEDDPTKIRKYVSSAYLMMFWIVAALTLAVWLIFPHINWNAVFNVPTSSLGPSTLTETVLITTTGILLQFFLRLISSILYALQRSAIIGLLNLVSTSSLLLVVSSVNLGTTAGNLVMLATAYAVAVNLPLIFVTLVVFRTTLRSCVPHIRFFDRQYARDVLRLGGVFFLLQVMYMVIATTDPFLISWLTDPKYVVDYQVYSRPFMIVSSLFTLALVPIWSAVTQAKAENDYAWIARLYARLSRVGALATVGTFAFVPVLQLFIDIWLRERSVTVDLGYALLFAIVTSAFIWSGLLSSITNGMGELKVQLICFSVGVVLKFPIAFALTSLTGSWIGVVASDVFALLLYCTIQPIWINRSLKQSMKHTPTPAPATRDESDDVLGSVLGGKERGFNSF